MQGDNSLDNEEENRSAKDENDDSSNFGSEEETQSDRNHSNFQKVEIDDSQLDIFLHTDEETNILGRPQISAIFDTTTRMFVGMYLSLEIPPNKSGGEVIGTSQK